MEKILVVFASLFMLIFSTLSFADSDRPCKPLEEACKAAGFYKGGSGSGKGLYKDCMQPAASGKKIAGINVKQADLDACKVKIDQMM